MTQLTLVGEIINKWCSSHHECRGCKFVDNPCKIPEPRTPENISIWRSEMALLITSEAN